MPEDMKDLIRSALVIAQHAQGMISNVHAQHHQLRSAIIHLEEAMQECTCEYCKPDNEEQS